MLLLYLLRNYHTNISSIKYGFMSSLENCTKLYKEVFNVDTQKTDILYKSLDNTTIPNGCEYFSRDEDDFHSLDTSGNPKFQLTNSQVGEIVGVIRSRN